MASILCLQKKVLDFLFCFFLQIRSVGKEFLDKPQPDFFFNFFFFFQKR